MLIAFVVGIKMKQSYIFFVIVNRLGSFWILLLMKNIEQDFLFGSLWLTSLEYYDYKYWWDTDTNLQWLTFYARMGWAIWKYWTFLC